MVCGKGAPEYSEIIATSANEIVVVLLICLNLKGSFPAHFTANFSTFATS